MSALVNVWKEIARHTNLYCYYENDDAHGSGKTHKRSHYKLKIDELLKFCGEYTCCVGEGLDWVLGIGLGNIWVCDAGYTVSWWNSVPICAWNKMLFIWFWAI